MHKVIDRDPEFAVIVPCFNEESAIASTVEELRRHLVSRPCEIIVVNDGSTDNSGRILDDLSANEDGLRVVHHEANRGYGAALKTGIRHARAEVIVITDADGTYPNQRVLELVDQAEDCDMVVGARIGDNVAHSKIRMLPKLLLRWYANWLTGRAIPDLNSGFRVFRKSVVEQFLTILPNTFSFTSTITVAMLTNYYSVSFVPIDYAPRVGRSKIRPFHDTLRFSQWLVRTGMYFAPLKVLAPFILVLALGFFASLYYDLFILENLTDKTLMLLLFCMNTGIFALLADMIDKRTGR